jgi:phosphatidate cytidylyltransferase
MIGPIVLVTLPGFLLGAVVMALANRRVTADLARARWLKLVVFAVIVHGVLGAAALGRSAVVALLLLILGIGARELAGAWRRIAPPRPRRAWWLFVVIAALCLGVGWWLPPDLFAALFVITAAFDGFSQVVGQWLGRRKLAPRLSPGKTVEGLLGGLVAAVAVALLVHELLQMSPGFAAVVGFCAGLAGLAGDLAASWLKRRAGLKDYSTLLPGQGGVLDRFDSLLGALALVGLPLAIACGNAGPSLPALG